MATLEGLAEGVGATSPRPFGEIPRLWIRVTDMTEEFLAREGQRAGGLNTLIAVSVQAVISAVIVAIFSGPELQRRMAEAPGEAAAAVTAVSTPIMIATAVLTLFLIPVAFYLSNGLCYVGARALGGTGDFKRQAYLVSLFMVPLELATSLVSLIPSMVAFPFVTIGAGTYMFVLQVRTLRTVHGLTTGRAVWAMIWPVLLFTAVCCGGLLLTGPVVNRVFTDVVRNLGTPTP